MSLCPQWSMAHHCALQLMARNSSVIGITISCLLIKSYITAGSSLSCCNRWLKLICTLVIETDINLPKRMKSVEIYVHAVQLTLAQWWLWCIWSFKAERFLTIASNICTWNVKSNWYILINNRVVAFGISNHLVLKPECSGRIRSITWLMMPWRRKEPGHQQPWYWLRRINTPLASTRTDFNFLQHLITEKC